MTKVKPSVLIAILALSGALVGCGATSEQVSAQTTNDAETTAVYTQASEETAKAADSDIYTERDLRQEADLTDATSLVVADGQDVNITEEGVYVLSGTANNVTITVDVDSSSKVQLVLDGLSITNEDAPAIYVVSADKVFVTTAEGSQNTLSTTGTFVADGDTKLDGVIFSKDDLVLNGLGTLTIDSSDNAVVAKDDLKVCGGTLVITCADTAFDVNDSAYFCDGDITATAVNDGIRADELVQVDGGSFVLSAREGIESTYVLINDGTISIDASDDGINAGQKSEGSTPTIDIRGGNISITMAQGDTDALDANGNLYISGGTVNITAQFAFDFDGTAELSGGEVYVNGEQVTTIENSMMMGGGMGQGPDGGMGGRGGKR